MHQAETRALKRATTLLLLISLARWGWSARPPTLQQADTSVLDELLDASRAAAEEASRRSAPLAAGERIDPNRAAEVELDRLPGIGPSVAAAIVASRENGTVFRRPEDLLEVRGIGPATLERISASLDLTAAPPSTAGRRVSAPAAAGGARMPDQVDLNRAGIDELQRLPGVGPVIAERILAARQKQVFTSVDDLIRVKGVGPATLERLRPLATLGSGHR